MANLAARVQSLPQELYDCIYDEVFTAATGTQIHINGRYKPPVQLCVTHASRNHFAQSYYGDNLFIVDRNDIVEEIIVICDFSAGKVARSILFPWFAFITESHLTMLRTMRFVSRITCSAATRRFQSPAGEGWKKNLRDLIQGRLTCDLGFKNLLPGLEVVLVELHFMNEDGSENVFKA